MVVPADVDAWLTAALEAVVAEREVLCVFTESDERALLVDVGVVSRATLVEVCARESGCV